MVDENPPSIPDKIREMQSHMAAVAGALGPAESLSPKVRGALARVEWTLQFIKRLEETGVSHDRAGALALLDREFDRAPQIWHDDAVALITKAIPAA